MLRLFLIQGCALLLMGCTAGFDSNNSNSASTQAMVKPSPSPVPTPSPLLPSPLPAPTPSPAPATPPACGVPIDGILNILNFGADATGLKDSTSAIQSTINCAHSIGANIIAVPDGNFKVSASISMMSGQYLIGNGPSRSKFVVADGAVIDSMLSLRNVSSVSIRNIAFMGNGSLATYNRAIYVTNDPGAPDMAHIYVINNTFENFQAECWVCVGGWNNQDGGITDVTIADNIFTSYEGNSVHPETIGYVTSAIWLGGTRLLPRPTAANPNAGLLTQVVVRNNQFHLPHIKNAVAMWAGVNHANVLDNVISSVGVSGSIPDDVAAYALLVYDNAYEYDNGIGSSWHSTGGVSPDDIQILRNQISGVHSCGIYAATVDSIYIQDNTISGQYDTHDGTLPKGAIALNGAKTAVVTGNNLQNNFFGMTVVARTDVSSVISTANNTIGAIRSGGTGVKLRGASGNLIQVSNTSIAGAGDAYGIYLTRNGGSFDFANIADSLTNFGY